MAQYSHYTVKAGDTLSGIANDNGMSVGELVTLNAIADPDRIAAGRVLNVRRLTPSRYVVRKGDSVSVIAAHFGIPAKALADANGISNPNILIAGTQLLIPVRVDTSHSAFATTADVPRPGAAVRAAAAIARRSVRARSAGLCYRYVKRALLAGGAVDHYLGGVAACEAGPLLEREGFVDILGLAGAGIASPYDAPTGAVIVYKATATATDRNRIYGHIEIRTDDGFASDYFSASARTGAASNGLTLVSPRGRAVSGIYVKADEPPALQPMPAPSAGTVSVLSPDEPWNVQNLVLPAVNGKYAGSIVEAARRCGIAAPAIAAIIDAEAARIAGTGQWDANSRAATSSATGLTQFVDATWRGEARRPGSVLNAEARAAGYLDDESAIVDDARLLAMRLNPRIAILAAADFAACNLGILRRSGFFGEPSALAKLAYLAHHEGPRRAILFLRGDMAYVSDALFRANVPQAERRRALLADAKGQKGIAYRRWLGDYIDEKIDVRRFMGRAAHIVVPPLSDLFA